ncbi:MAG: hypothetical protein MUE44_09010 [Oscillatoriaceae cyanobacterium Prado104]|jgi:hypothetical protein|nr:hypothetical protein [Oscillatoriaceae cyanobacterium Prado104]
MDISVAIERAFAFLVEARDRAGFWNDFDLAPGSSDEWVTAYVGLAIASLETESAIHVAFEAWQWLLSRRKVDEGWGYNRLTPRDADSTLWALKLAEVLGYGHWASAQQAYAFLEQHMCECGGMTTYASDVQIRQFIGASASASFVGWCGPHTCVTAAVATLEQFRMAACDFLKTRQESDGCWRSYWWTEDEYATALAAEALLPHSPQQVQSALNWAINRIRSDGSVPSTVFPLGSCFATAWIIRLLLLSDDLNQVMAPLQQAVHWLLEQQNSDGSWAASAGLRVAFPHMCQPRNFNEWKLGGKKEGAICLDQKGLFTTATVFQTLVVLFRVINRYPDLRASGENENGDRSLGDREFWKKSAIALTI